MRKLIVPLLLAAVPLLGACHLRQMLRGPHCESRAPFRTAQTVPPLRAPEGLPAADTHNGLKIPDEVAAAKPRGANEPCLDEPPPFYADRPKPAAAK